jgi:hypothetical protein
MKKIAVTLLIIPLLGLASPDGGGLYAYSFWCARWSPPEAFIRINPNLTDWQAGTPDQQILAHITGAFQWNNTGGSHFDFHYDGATTIDYVANDGTNALFGSPGNGNGVLAETWCQQSGGTFNGFDIRYYDGDVVWNGPGGGIGLTDIWAVSAHELGHGLGLGHSGDNQATMYFAYFIGMRTLDTDDLNGVRARYSGQPDILIRIIPLEERMEFGPSGGTWVFDARAENTTGSSRTVDVWFDARLPGGGSYGPLIGPVEITLNAGQVRSVTGIGLNVPPAAPAGVYVVRMKVGTYPSTVDDESHVGFLKTATKAASDGILEGLTLEPVVEWF